MDAIPENDWKVFKELHPIALNRYCERLLADAQRKIADPKKTPHERYRAVVELIDTHNKEIERAFGDYRRSTARLQVRLIYSLGVLTEEELARFSPQVQALAKLEF